MIEPEAALIACRFLMDGAVIYLWGTSSYLAAFVPDELERQVASRLHPSHVVAVAIAIGTTLALLPLRAATIGDGWASAADASTIGAVLFQTNVGTAWQAQAAAALLLLVANTQRRPQRQAAIAMTAGLFLATFAITGHAAMHTGWVGFGHRVNDVIHLLSGGTWLGSLVPVLLILPLLDNATHGPAARVALMRFSTAGHVAVTLVIATGTINMWLIVGGVPVNWSLTYQLLLSLKMVLVATMVAVAIANRYVLVPRLARHGSAAKRALTAATAGEIALGATVLALVSCFGTLQPT